MLAVQETVVRFLEAIKDWESAFEGPVSPLTRLPGKSEECIFLERTCDLKDMETEDDEKYQLSTTDGQVRSVFSRFEIRPVLARACSSLREEQIELLISMAWSYPRVVINRRTGDFDPYAQASGMAAMPILPATGGPPRRIVHTE